MSLQARKRTSWNVRPTNSNQPAHPRSLIRVFVVRMKKLCNLGFPKSAKWRFWSDCASAQADPNFRWAQLSVGIVSDVATYFNQWRDGYKSHRFQVGHGFKTSSNDKYLNWDNESTCYRVRKLYSRSGARTLDPRITVPMLYRPIYPAAIITFSPA